MHINTHNGHTMIFHTYILKQLLPALLLLPSTNKNDNVGTFTALAVWREGDEPCYVRYLMRLTLPTCRAPRSALFYDTTKKLACGG